jgi:hypothetical protein
VEEREILIEGGYRGPHIKWRPTTLADPFKIAALTGLVAAIVHALVVREHLAHWWGYGAFFAGVAAAQGLTAVALWRRPGRKLLYAVALGDVALIALYVVSRTVGAPPIGPHAGVVEPIEPIDVVAKIAEGVQLAAILFAFDRATDGRSKPRLRIQPIVVLAAIAAAAVAGPQGHTHQRSAAAAPVILTADPGADIHETHAEEPPANVPAPEASPPAQPRVCTPDGAPGDPDPITTSAVVYWHDYDLWLAAPPDGDPRRLTTNGVECSASTSTFRDAKTVTFVGDGGIYDLTLSTGDTTRLVKDLSGVSALAWSPDGSALAFLDWSGKVSLYDRSSKTTRVLRSPDEEPPGRCGSMDDDTFIGWSSDGRSLLVVSTGLDFTNKTVFLLDLDGKHLIEPLFATHARWVNDVVVIYRDYESPRRWHSLNVVTGHTVALDMHEGTHHAAVSPDGRYVAYSDEEATPNLYLYDFSRGTERVLISGYAAPLWLSPKEIAVEKTKACEGDECMGHGGWLGAGETAAFDLAGHRTRTLSMDSTENASAFIPHEPPPSPSPAPAPSTPPPPPEPSPSPSPTEPTSSPSPSPSPTSTESPDPIPTPTPTI